MNSFMHKAVLEALKAQNNGDVPVGAAIISNGEIIAQAYNKKEKNKDATSHAEMIAISRACKKKKNWHLDDCDLYCTMEPCMMCCGAIIQSRIKKVYFIVKNEKYGCTHLLKNSKIEVIQMNDEYEIKKILSSFFKDKR